MVGCCGLGEFSHADDDVSSTESACKTNQRVREIQNEADKQLQRSATASVSVTDANADLRVAVSTVSSSHVGSAHDCKVHCDIKFHHIRIMHKHTLQLHVYVHAYMCVHITAYVSMQNTNPPRFPDSKNVSQKKRSNF